MIKHDPSITEFKSWERRIYDSTLTMLVTNPQIPNWELAKRLNLSDTTVARPARSARLTLGINSATGRRPAMVADKRRFDLAVKHITSMSKDPVEGRPRTLRSVAQQFVHTAQAEGVNEISITVDGYSVTLTKI